jgi:hypothetical protein
MSAVEQAVEKVKALSEEEARELLAWLETHADADDEHILDRIEDELEREGVHRVDDIRKVLGWARKYHPEPRTTAEWMKILREGEED